MSIPEAEASPPKRGTFAPRWRARTLAICLGLSLLLHLGTVGTAWLIRSLQPSVTLEFEASRAVSLMARLGEAPAPRVTTAPEVELEPIDPLESAPEPEASPAPDPEPEAEPEAAPDPEPEASPEPEPEAAPEPETALEPEPEPELAQAPAESTPERPRRPRRPPAEPTPEPTPDPPPEPAPDRTPPPEPPSESTEEAAQQPPSQRYPEGTLHPVATDIGMWGPEGASVVVLLRNDRIRESRFRGEVETLLSALPDWQTLAGGAAIDPIEDVDAMLVASADPRYIDQTFLAAVHRLDPGGLSRALDGGVPGGVRWQEEEGRIIGRTRSRDPRVFVLPDERLFLFTRPEFLEPLAQGAPRPRGLEGALDTPPPAEPEAPPAEDDAEGDAEGAPGEAAGSAAGPEVGERDGPPRRGPLRVRRGARGAEDAEDPAEAEDASGGAPGAPEPGADAPAQAGPSADAGDAPPPIARREQSIVRSGATPPLREDGWVQGLLDIAHFGGTSSRGPAALFTAQGIRTLRVAGMGRVAGPGALHMAFHLDREVRVEARLTFASAEEASAFLSRWPDIVHANRLQLRLVGLHAVLEGAELEQDQDEAYLRFPIDARTLRAVATTVSVAMRTRHGYRP